MIRSILQFTFWFEALSFLLLLLLLFYIYLTVLIFIVFTKYGWDHFYNHIWRQETCWVTELWYKKRSHCVVTWNKCFSNHCSNFQNWTQNIKQHAEMLSKLMDQFNDSFSNALWSPYLINSSLRLFVLCEINIMARLVNNIAAVVLKVILFIA